jgi:hypothetical protein
MTQPIALDHSQNGQTKNNIVSLTVASARLLKLSKAFFDQSFCLVSLFGQLFPVQFADHFVERSSPVCVRKSSLIIHDDSIGKLPAQVDKKYAV